MAELVRIQIRRILIGSLSALMVSVLASGSSGSVRAQAGDFVLCSWARHLTLAVPLSTQVYKWVPVNLMLG